MELQIAGFLDNSLVNGKGIRSVLFVSGCKHNCKGCHNETMQSYSYGDSISIDDIYSRIMNNVPLINGVTFSGGEPFDKAKGLAKLSKMLKEKNMNIWCYTGYDFEELLKDEKERNELLNNVDVLIDGKFDEDQMENTCKYRGSVNQRIIDVKQSINQGKIVLLSV